jgi:hypothetical protein
MRLVGRVKDEQSFVEWIGKRASEHKPTTGPRLLGGS